MILNNIQVKDMKDSKFYNVLINSNEISTQFISFFLTVVVSMATNSYWFLKVNFEQTQLKLNLSAERALC